jgi:hypothetical protein
MHKRCTLLGWAHVVSDPVHAYAPQGPEGTRSGTGLTVLLCTARATMRKLHIHVACHWTQPRTGLMHTKREACVTWTCGRVYAAQKSLIWGVCSRWSAFLQCHFHLPARCTIAVMIAMHIVVQLIHKEPQASGPSTHATPFSGHKQHHECLCSLPCVDRVESHEAWRAFDPILALLPLRMQLSDPFSIPTPKSASHSYAPGLINDVYVRAHARQLGFNAVVSYVAEAALAYVPRTLAHTPSQKFVRRGSGTRTPIAPSRETLSLLALVSVTVTYVGVMSCKGCCWFARNPE